MATATAIYTVEVPEDVSGVIESKAKAENVSAPDAILDLLRYAIEYSEEGHIWEEALERKRTCTGKFLSHDEFWKQANAVSGNL